MYSAAINGAASKKNKYKNCCGHESLKIDRHLSLGTFSSLRLKKLALPASSPNAVHKVLKPLKTVQLLGSFLERGICPVVGSRSLI